MAMLELLLAAETAASEGPAVHPLVVGGVSFGIFFVMLLATMAFGRGREHT